MRKLFAGATCTDEQFRNWLLKLDTGIAVMLTTYDVSSRDLALDFVRWLRPKYANRLTSSEVAMLTKYLEAHTICRRFEIHYINSSTMLNIFGKWMLEAQRLFVNGTELAFHDLGTDDCGRIRVVIDDFSSLRSIYTDFADDPRLLPSIKFMLGRLGVTTLIIDTQTGRPDIAVAERYASELRQMADNRLYTWCVSFFGENRVAISAIPPLAPEFAGIVRELRWEQGVSGNSGYNSLVVDPHFELYMGIDENKPRASLEIKLFADVPGFQNYVNEENELLGELFTAFDIETGTVINAYPAQKYDFIRNARSLQKDTRLSHTLVVRVDEFWAKRLPDNRRAGAFRPQWKYLNAITRKPDGLRNHEVDTYGVFQKGTRTTERTLRRKHFFDGSIGYDLTNSKSPEIESIERIPFSWDFGFLLCKRNAWERAGKKRLRSQDGRKREVAEIWNQLHKIPDNLEDQPEESVSWRDFLEACQNVAESESLRLRTEIPSFDSSLLTPETFSCLFAEIWASEIKCSLRKKSQNKARRFVSDLSTRTWAKSSGQNMEKWVEEFRMELYKTWLLLVEALDFSEIVRGGSKRDFEFQTGTASTAAIASRHWYKTACQWVEDNPTEEPIVAVRLPGSFSVRGDWFLSVSGGSRSIRVADRALDILSSRRANIVRLHQGLGLPTRHLENGDEFRTRLIINGQYGEPKNANYGHIKKLGAASDGEFNWLWRNSLDNYHRHSRVWHKYSIRSWSGLSRSEFRSAARGSADSTFMTG
ncbi:MAG: hypothetical protein IPJ30_12515 [Acidobacteria bacterium]|nr:hypothetical protein [Acidobacteriota bacterium]